MSHLPKNYHKWSSPHDKEEVKRIVIAKTGNPPPDYWWMDEEDRESIEEECFPYRPFEKPKSTARRLTYEASYTAKPNPHPNTAKPNPHPNPHPYTNFFDEIEQEEAVACNNMEYELTEGRLVFRPPDYIEDYADPSAPYHLHCTKCHLMPCVTKTLEAKAILRKVVKNQMIKRPKCKKQLVDNLTTSIDKIRCQVLAIRYRKVNVSACVTEHALSNVAFRAHLLPKSLRFDFPNPVDIPRKSEEEKSQEEEAKARAAAVAKAAKEKKRQAMKLAIRDFDSDHDSSDEEYYRKYIEIKPYDHKGWALINQMTKEVDEIMKGKYTKWTCRAAVKKAAVKKDAVKKAATKASEKPKKDDLVCNRNSDSDGDSDSDSHSDSDGDSDSDSHSDTEEPSGTEEPNTQGETEEHKEPSTEGVMAKLGQLAAEGKLIFSLSDLPEYKEDEEEVEEEVEEVPTQSASQFFQEVEVPTQSASQFTSQSAQLTHMQENPIQASTALGKRASTSAEDFAFARRKAKIPRVSIEPSDVPIKDYQECLENRGYQWECYADCSCSSQTFSESCSQPFPEEY
ncbi:hypothetical protein SEMRO_398_G134760.1 [Seminavis robusta]|uniref:Uncharacterized protein n=1 Tax=Seminavis robusta TaxID=568900 RepID=A0A9N8DVS7_9STRA|nr:hypothetical protein SEMRO_398_G134760.1 [Seminavis robusta]|eukprot:Sro398_g134760.1 n/a (567) ;mRNA; f:57500-59318